MLVIVDLTGPVFVEEDFALQVYSAFGSSVLLLADVGRDYTATRPGKDGGRGCLRQPFTETDLSAALQQLLGAPLFEYACVLANGSDHFVV